ncbi:MAG TPA: SDR family oxidoreductase [Candidatus Nanopelagicaceae bacterium]
MSKTALVTGATSGIGASFTRLLATKGYDIVLVARNEVRLTECSQSLKRDFGVACEIISADLATTQGLKSVVDRVSNLDNPIAVLINNAGFGINKSFLVSDAETEEQLLDVLVKAPMHLMHAVLPVMRSRNDGMIINVSSVAAWIAGGTYSAAKSYLTVLSESLHTELKGTNVKILALGPGFTRTEFHQRGRMRMNGLPKFMWLDADRVVAQAWGDAAKGKAISVPGRQYLALSFIMRYGPRPLVRKMGMNVRVRPREKKQ